MVETFLVRGWRGGWRDAAPAVQRVDHRDTTLVTVGSTLGGKEYVNDLQRSFFAEVAGAERQHVGVVVLSRVLRGGHVERHGRAHAGHLVGDHAGADPGAVDDHPAPRLAARYRFGRGPRENGIVDRLLGRRAGVVHGHTAGAQVPLDGFLQLEAAVIAGEDDRARSGAHAAAEGSRKGASWEGSSRTIRVPSAQNRPAHTRPTRCFDHDVRSSLATGR
jgi:hypothetical protein